MKKVIEGILLLTAMTATVGGMWNRLQLKKGIGVRFIQFLGLGLLLPIAGILVMEGRISQEMTGAIFATAVGGVIGSFGKDELK